MPIHTQEVKALIAPLFGVPMEDIDDVFIGIRGFCNKCGGHDAYTILASPVRLSDVVEMASQLVIARIEQEEE